LPRGHPPTIAPLRGWRQPQSLASYRPVD
jgi:hypothetical protein